MYLNDTTNDEYITAKESTLVSTYTDTVRKQKEKKKKKEKKRKEEQKSSEEILHITAKKQQVLIVCPLSQ